MFPRVHMTCVLDRQVITSGIKS
jgi:hypothetical protein